MGGQSGCERRIEVFVKIQKKIFFWGGGWGGGVGGGSGSGLGVRVDDVNEELKFLCEKFEKKKIFFWGGGGGCRGVSGRGRVGGGSGWM